MNISFRQYVKTGLLLATLLFAAVGRADDSESPLIAAAKTGDVTSVKSLLGKGADINARDGYGRTPLHWVAQWGRKEVVELLLANKADVDAKDKVGQTALHLAAYDGQKEIVEVLLAHGADVNAKDEDGETPLHKTAVSLTCRQCKEVVEVLLAHGADVNARDKNGETPLEKAKGPMEFFAGQKGVVELLMAQTGPRQTRDAEKHADDSASPAALSADGVDAQPEAALNLSELKANAEGGNVEAQGKLGLVYGNGLGVPRKPTEAVKWYRKAAEQGDANSQNNLGVMYKNGWGVSKDCAEAVKLFRQAAEQGSVKAQENLGVMYSGGFVQHNIPEAIKWFRAAAEKGDIQAEWSLGQLYDDGFHLEKNHAEAMSWYRKAAEQGDAHSQFALGVLYFRGEGVAHDSIEGYKWLALSIRQGVKGLLLKQDSMTQLLPPEQQAGLEEADSKLLEADLNYRNSLVQAMSPAEIAEGERRADSFAGKEVIQNYPAKTGYSPEIKDLPQQAEDTAKPQQAKEESSETPPASILSQIKAKAEAKYPDDFEMQAYTVKNETEAYQALRDMTSVSGVPSSVLDGIKSKAASQWPDDYGMQVYTIKNQTDAYQELHR